MDMYEAYITGLVKRSEIAYNTTQALRPVSEGRANGGLAA